jgi:hypothetical protein
MHVLRLMIRTLKHQMQVFGYIMLEIYNQEISLHLGKNMKMIHQYLLTTMSKGSIIKWTVMQHMNMNDIMTLC